MSDYGSFCKELIKNSKYKKGDKVRILNNKCGQPYKWIGKIGVVKDVSTTDIHGALRTYEVEVLELPYIYQSFFYFETDLKGEDN